MSRRVLIPIFLVWLMVIVFAVHVTREDIAPTVCEGWPDVKEQR